MVHLVHLRKYTGRNESEPMCSVVRVSIYAGRWFGSVEPFQIWRRLVCSVDRQDFRIPAGGIGRQKARLLPKVMWMRTDQLPGVAGMACMESNRVNHGRSGSGLCSRRSNPPLGEGIPSPEVGATHSSNDGRDNITLQEQRGRP